MFASSASAVFAEPPAGIVRLRQHYVQHRPGEVAIAEQFCDGAQSVALHNLHNKVHLGQPGTGGFNNPNNPVDIRATGCP